MVVMMRRMPVVVAVGGRMPLATATTTALARWLRVAARRTISRRRQVGVEPAVLPSSALPNRQLGRRRRVQIRVVIVLLLCRLLREPSPSRGAPFEEARLLLMAAVHERKRRVRDRLAHQLLSLGAQARDATRNALDDAILC